MRKMRASALLLGAGLLLAGCSDDTFVVPDLNNAGLEELANNPNFVTVQLAAQGLMIGARAGIDGQGGYVNTVGVFGRESIVFDPADPRWIDELLDGELDAAGFGAGEWAVRYDNVRLATVLLDALEVVEGFDPDELEAIRGFTKFTMAQDLLLVLNTRMENGIVAELNPFGEELPPIVGPDAAFDRIEQLMVEAVGHLGAGSASFPFSLSTGYAGFDTPADLIPAVRGLQARVAVYRENYGQALTFLGDSFLDPQGDFATGIYHAYGTAQGQNSNNLFQGADPTIAAFPTTDDEAKEKPGGGLDDRAQKVSEIDPPLRLQGAESDLRFEIYESLSAPIPIVRNEELLLLRAEARWFSGDMEGALEDLNTVRTTSGGLGELALADIDTEEEFVDNLLYERWFSLMLEGHRWIDVRRFGGLDDLPNVRAGDFSPSAMPIPRDECLARGLNPVGGGCG